jgi:hypothetical protein
MLYDHIIFLTFLNVKKVFMNKMFLHNSSIFKNGFLINLYSFSAPMPTLDVGADITRIDGNNLK